MSESQLALSWDNFQQTMQTGIFQLLETEELVDVTFCVEGEKLKAHKMILSVCSPFFKELFESNPCQHPIIFLNEVKYRVMKDLLTYMYKGEVHLIEELLPAFVRLGESLQIRGLTNEEPQPSPIAHQPIIRSTPAPKATSTPTIRRTMTTVVRPPATGAVRRSAPTNVTSGGGHSVPMKRPRLAGHRTRFVLDSGRTPKVEKEEVLSGVEGENDEDLIQFNTGDIEQHNYSFASTNIKPSKVKPGRRKSNLTASIDPMEMELAIIHRDPEHNQSTAPGTVAVDSEDDSESPDQSARRVIISSDGAEVDIVMEHDVDGEVMGEEDDEDLGDVDEDAAEQKLVLTAADGEVEETTDDGGGDGALDDVKDDDSKQDGEIAIVRTIRKQEMPRYIVDGFVFHVNIMKGNPPMTYLRCLEYKRLGCHARAVMPTNGSIQDIQLTQMHNHPPDFAAEEKIVFMRELKDFLLRHINLSTKEVYDLLQPIYPTAAYETPYDSIKNKMGRWKRSFILDNEIDMRLGGLGLTPEPTIQKKRNLKVEVIIPD